MTKFAASRQGVRAQTEHNLTSSQRTQTEHNLTSSQITEHASCLNIKVCIGKLFSLFRIQYICCGYSKEQYRQENNYNFILIKFPSRSMGLMQ